MESGSQLISGRNSYLTVSNTQSHSGTAEKESQGKSHTHDDSPDFNRNEEIVSVTDDLTVSKSDITTDFDIGSKS